MRHHLVSAGLFSSALLLCAQETAYSSAVYSDRNAGGGTFAALDHQAYDIPISDVDWAAASARPRGIVHLKAGLSGLCGLICGDMSVSSVGNDCAQWKSGEGDSHPVRLDLFVQMDALGFGLKIAKCGDVVDSFTLHNINIGVKYTLPRKDFEQSDIHFIYGPFVSWDIDAHPSAFVKNSRRHVFTYDMRGGQESAMLIKEKGTPIDLNTVWSDTNDGTNRLFDRRGRFNEFVFLGKAGEDTHNTIRDNDQYDGQTSIVIDGSKVKPFVDRCEQSSTNDVWMVKCPKETEEGHQVILPPPFQNQ
jgi:hypothetical protein